MTTSDTPEGKMLFGSPENLASWGPSADSGVIACMTAADAKKAEILFNGLQRENNALRAQLADVEQALNLWKGLAELGNVQQKSTARRGRLLIEQLAERDAALAGCYDSIYALANYPEARKSLAAAANKLLANLPESVKQAAKVIKAARKQTEMADKGYDDLSYLDACEATCQAVQGMKG